MTPPPTSSGPPHPARPPSAEGPARPGGRGPDPIVGRRPVESRELPRRGASSFSRPPGRLRPHLSKLAGGRAAAPAPSCTPPPGGAGSGRGPNALRAFLSLNSLPNAALRAVTQKRGLSRSSARVLAWRVAIRWVLPPRGPAGPCRQRPPEICWPCVGYFGCRSKVVQVKGKRGRARGRGAGQGWGGVEAPRTHPQPGCPGGKARAGQWVLPCTSASGEGLVSHRGFQPSHSEPAS